MRFQVPQFIDVEDKIFGPFTFRQFIYLAGGAGLSYLLFKLLPFLIALLFALPIAGLAFALAFVRINNRPFIEIAESAFNFALRDKLYLWKKDAEEKKKEDIKVVEEKKKPNEYLPKLSESKLHDISWGLDVLDSKKNNN
jgi:hypothetical protein